MMDKVLEAFGGIDILVNNAGGTRSLFKVLDYPVEEWDFAVDVNLRGPFLCSRRAGQWMAKQKAGKILNIASVCGYAGVPLRGAYGPAKAGIMNLTMVMAVELGQYRINVNCIAPGLVSVPRILGLAEKGGFDIDKAKHQTPLGRLCEPEDVAKAAVFLVSEDADNITGVTLPVDAGWLAYKTLT
jgi:NAD(P)-dependent dehydrogenase (short-subunit alcohol dehydrogenase family)